MKKNNEIKKLPLKQIVVDVMIFCTEVLVLISEDQEHVLRAVKYHQKNNPHTIDKGVAGQCWFEEERPPILWIKRFPKSPREVGTLVHEVTHISTYIMKNAGIPIDRECTDEVLAHLVGYITQQIIGEPEKKKAIINKYK